ncbi:hypothetical protein D3C86_1349020 [compost metagenome]
MYNARATFNAAVRSVLGEGVHFHTEDREETVWPSYRIHWLAFHPTRKTGEMVAIIQVDVNVPDGDTAGVFQRAGRLQEALGLARYGARPQVQKYDFTDPDNPKPIPLWMEYGIQLGKGWVKVPQKDPALLRLVLTLELYFPVA